MSLCVPWATVDDVAGCCEKVEFACDLEETAQAASEILYVLSGRQFPGVCEATVRPCGPCGCHDRCSCRPSQIVLQPQPAISVTSVLIDGEILLESEYRLDPGSRLVRLNGEVWPCCQDLSLPSTEEGTFEIEYSYGQEPPVSGKRAAALLACELARACTPGVECQLPARVTSITRQGVSMALLDPQDFLDNGRTGIYEIDLFLRTFNPDGLTQPARVINPDRLHSLRRMA